MRGTYLHNRRHRYLGEGVTMVDPGVTLLSLSLVWVAIGILALAIAVLAAVLLTRESRPYLVQPQRPGYIEGKYRVMDHGTRLPVVYHAEQGLDRR